LTNEPFTIRVTRDGEITYPYGCTNSYEVQRIIENKLNQRYVERCEAEHKRQLKPVPTRAEESHVLDNKKRQQHHEDLAIVKAYLTQKTWKDRIQYLAKLGYQYSGSNKTIERKLQQRIEDLTQSGEWSKLVEEVES